jgi:hypothetical protein
MSELVFQNEHSALPAQCPLVQLDLVSRHGTRNPTLDFVLSCHTLHSFIHHHPNWTGLDSFLQTWTCPFHPEEAGELVYQGQLDMIRLAQRALSRYSVDWETSHVRSTNKSRTLDSSRSFLTGLLGQEKAHTFPILVVDRSQDEVLSFYKNCEVLYFI